MRIHLVAVHTLPETNRPARFDDRVTHALSENGAAVLVLSRLDVSPGLVQSFHGCWGPAPAWIGWSRTMCHHATFILIIDVCEFFALQLTTGIDTTTAGLSIFSCSRSGCTSVTECNAGSLLSDGTH